LTVTTDASRHNATEDTRRHKGMRTKLDADTERGRLYQATAKFVQSELQARTARFDCEILPGIMEREDEEGWEVWHPAMEETIFVGNNVNNEQPTPVFGVWVDHDWNNRGYAQQTFFHIDEFPAMLDMLTRGIVERFYAPEENK
jgi:hypothetical protein